MSYIQERAKPQLIPLFKGSPWAIGIDAQTAIASWAAMATTTSEYLSHDTTFVAVNDSDRRYLMDMKLPPRHWRVWIGSYNRSDWIGQWAHTSLHISATNNDPNAEVGGFPLPNTQTTTFVIGKLFVHVMSSDVASNTAPWDWRPYPRARALLVEIWPIKRWLIGFPRQVMTDTDVQRISVAFFNAIDAIGKKHGH